METKRRLRLIFNTEDGKWVLSLADPKQGLLPNEVESAMSTIIDRNIFGIPPLSIVGAELVETGTQVIV